MQVKCIVDAGAAASFPNHVVLNLGSIWSTSLLPWQPTSGGSAPSGEGIIPSGRLPFSPGGHAQDLLRLGTHSPYRVRDGERKSSPKTPSAPGWAALPGPEELDIERFGSPLQGEPRTPFANPDFCQREKE